MAKTRITSRSSAKSQRLRDEVVGEEVAVQDVEWHKVGLGGQHLRDQRRTHTTSAPQIPLNVTRAEV